MFGGERHKVERGRDGFFDGVQSDVVALYELLARMGKGGNSFSHEEGETIEEVEWTPEQKREQ